MSASLQAESAACLVVAAVFKTVEGQSVLGGFNSFPLRHFFVKNEAILEGVPSRPSTRQKLAFAIEDVFKK